MAQRSLYDLINGENASGNPDLAEDVANPDAVIARQRMVYDFAGRGQCNGNFWWVAGDATRAYANDGLALTGTGSSGSDHGDVSFNNECHFDHKGSSMLWVSNITATATAQRSTYQGLFGDYTTAHQGYNSAYGFIHSTGMALGTGNASSSGFTNTYDDSGGGVCNYISTAHKISQNDGYTDMFSNNVLTASRTETQSTRAMQPCFVVWGTTILNIRYCEAWNH